MENNISIIGKRCTGCRGCEQICPVAAIKFIENKEGFFYPVIDEKCIQCGKCLKTCPVNEYEFRNNCIKSYAATMNNIEELKKSSSGGVFYSIALYILESSGHVWGCAYDNDNKKCVQHICIDDAKNLYRLQGSKYVQSDMTDVYKNIKEQLSNNKLVLFSGTPCQVAGLYRYVGGQHPLLYTVDIICHGVPSRRLFSEYIKWLEKQKNGKLIDYNFRDKRKHGWSLTYSYTLLKEKREKNYSHMASLDPYYTMFLSGATYRESCYDCKFSRPERTADITLGDFWGVDQVLDVYDYNGVSAVIVNTKKGKQIFDGISEMLKYQEVSYKEICLRNGNLNSPTKRPQIRDSVYELVEPSGFEKINKYYGKTKDYYVDFVKDMIPNKYRQDMKRFLKMLCHRRK